MGHEEKCRRCGKCCYHKVRIGQDVIWTPCKCIFLDESTKLCTVYSNRHKIDDLTCLTIPEAIARRALPNDCPYVADVKGYKGPRKMVGDEIQIVLGQCMSIGARNEDS